MLKIDHRETKLKEFFSNSKFEYESVIYENLVHGDIQIIFNGEESPLFIFERKTIDDLIASIKDGRYKNQKAILLESGYETKQIYYIIEGPLKWNSQPKQSIDKTVHGAIINTLLRDKIGIFYTRNIEETFELIRCIYQRVKDDPSKYKKETIEIEKQIKTLSIKDKNNPETCFKNMLCQIPHVNIRSAEAIVSQYQTMQNLIYTLKPKSQEEKSQELNQLKINNRKISSKVVESIIEYLF
jgi:ERCC4-type nuclease